VGAAAAVEALPLLTLRLDIELLGEPTPLLTGKPRSEDVKASGVILSDELCGDRGDRGDRSVPHSPGGTREFAEATPRDTEAPRGLHTPAPNGAGDPSLEAVLA
jgi:hypothetical protein